MGGVDSGVVKFVENHVLWKRPVASAFVNYTFLIPLTLLIQIPLRLVGGSFGLVWLESPRSLKRESMSGISHT